MQLQEHPGGSLCNQIGGTVADETSNMQCTGGGRALDDHAKFLPGTLASRTRLSMPCCASCSARFRFAVHSACATQRHACTSAGQRCLRAAEAHCPATLILVKEQARRNTLP